MASNLIHKVIISTACFHSAIMSCNFIGTQHACEQLAKGRYVAVHRPEIKLMILQIMCLLPIQVCCTIVQTSSHFPLFQNLVTDHRSDNKADAVKCLSTAAWWNYDDDEIVYFTVRWKTRENGPISRGSQSEVSTVRDLWGKRFTKKVSSAFRVKEWRGDGK